MPIRHGALIKGQKQYKSPEYKLKTTTWKNNTSDTFRFELLLEGGINGNLIEIVLKPGESKVLDSIYDNGIQVVNEHGQIISGACPRLTKVGHEEFELHPNLDYQLIEERELQKSLALKGVQAAAMERFLLNQTVKANEAVMAQKFIDETKQETVEAEKRKSGRPKNIVVE